MVVASHFQALQIGLWQLFGVLWLVADEYLHGQGLDEVAVLLGYGGQRLQLVQ